MSSNPLVTIIAACYNHSNYLEECLSSIQRQTYENIQLIITDDSSSDNSVEIIEKWLILNNVQCAFIKNKKNIGLCKTLNRALKCAEGKFICIVATDDILVDDKVKDQVECFEKLSSEYGVIYTDAIMINEQGDRVDGMFISSYRNFDRPPDGYILDELIDGNFIPIMTTMIRKECFDYIGGFDESLIYEDWDMWLRISEKYKFNYFEKICAKYRILPTSLARNLGIRGLEDEYSIIFKCLKSKNNCKKNKDKLENLLIYKCACLHKVKSSIKFKAFIQTVFIVMDKKHVFSSCLKQYRLFDGVFEFIGKIKILIKKI